MKFFLAGLCMTLLTIPLPGLASTDSFDDSPPEWERLLWGGRIGQDQGTDNPPPENPDAAVLTNPDSRAEDGKQDSQPTTSDNVGPKTPDQPDTVDSGKVTALPSQDQVNVKENAERNEPSVNPVPNNAPRFREVVLNNIPPLYLSPKLPGEGIWQYQDMPSGDDGKPVMFRTSYRPSMQYPNAIVHMLTFDMSRLSMKLYLGSAERGGSKETAIVEKELRPKLVAITNAMWKQKHSGDAGTIYQGSVIKDLAQGVATLVTYKDHSVDVLEWCEGIPLSLIKDAKQLRHLIVKNGKVVESIIRAGKTDDSEIGLGFLLAEDPVEGQYNNWYGLSPWQNSINFGPDWFIASRSAFGIRPDGNLVFAVGHHLSTRDLARAMVLAGCERAIHADANPHNVLGNIYFVGPDGKVLKKEKLSPEQKSGTLDRYVDRSYTSDFLGFFLRRAEGGAL